jgi:hypothetical protein
MKRRMRKADFDDVKKNVETTEKEELEFFSRFFFLGKVRRMYSRRVEI